MSDTLLAHGSQSAFRKLQLRAFWLTWLSYACYYLTRKNVSVVKSTLVEVGEPPPLPTGTLDPDQMLSFANKLTGYCQLIADQAMLTLEGVTLMSTMEIGLIESLYLAMYAAGQFINGGLGDRFGPRRMLAFGMIASAAASLSFGLASAPVIFGVAFTLNGYFQSTGWPNNVKAMAAWFGEKGRGVVMGLWCTCYQVGGLAATALATYLLVNWGWREAFFVPAGIVSVMGLLILVFLAERPPEDCLSWSFWPSDLLRICNTTPLRSFGETQSNKQRWRKIRKRPSGA